MDDDEADFLDHVDKTRWEADRNKRMEEELALSEFRTKVAELREKDVDTLIKTEIGLIKTETKKSVFADQGLPSIGATKTSQSQRLAGLVKRKSTSESSTAEVVPEKMSRHGKLVYNYCCPGFGLIIFINFLGTFRRIRKTHSRYCDSIRQQKFSN